MSGGGPPARPRGFLGKLRQRTAAPCVHSLDGAVVARNPQPMPVDADSAHDPYDYEIEEPDISAIVTEDDEPLDNFGSEKQQRLLTEPLYSSWSGPPPDEEGAPRPFVVAANVGLFAAVKQPPIVPDIFVSLDAKIAADFWEKKHRTYFVWEFGKPPEIAIEIVSNKEGGELTKKRARYARIRVAHYVVWDPAGIYDPPNLRAFEIRGDLYVPMERAFFPTLGLGLVPWEGSFEGTPATWLRWCTEDGALVPTGAERAVAERARAENERARAENERARAERLAAKLRAMGVDPDGD